MAELWPNVYVLAMKRAIIVHGWASNPEDGWFPWLKEKLEAQDIHVDIPAMPHPMIPTIADWVPALAKAADQIDHETIFVGHSIGCQTILRYLQTIDTPIQGVVFVAGFIKDLVLDPDEPKEIATPWLETPIQFEKLRAVIPRSIAIFSDNDRFVPLKENSESFSNLLGSTIVVDHGKKHFAGDQGIMELPSVLDAALKLFA